MLELCMLASASSGNAVYIATEKTKILVDAGLSGRRLTAALAEIGADPTTLQALLISHDHNDHIYGAGVMSRRYRLPLYATEPTWKAAKNRLGKIAAENCRRLPLSGRLVIGDLLVETFPVPHDAAGPVGFVFRTENHAAALVTDLGYVTPYILDRLQQLDCIIVEANYDEEMLMNGPYPWPLKQRIKGNTGHLSNTLAAEMLLKILTPKTKHVILAHLSEHNNLPQLAYDTVYGLLAASGHKQGKEVFVQVAKRHTPSCYLRLA